MICQSQAVNCVVALTTLLLLMPTPVKAIEIEIEFASDSFFSQNAQAVAAINAAAQHIGDAITSTLAPIDQASFTDTLGNTTATLDWTFSFRDPFTQEPIGNLPAIVPNLALGNDVVRIFVDAQPLSGIIVGQGVPAGARADIGASILGPGPLNANAIQGAVGLADSEMNRGGGGALIDVLFDGGETIEGTDIDSIRHRVAFGGITFDNDTNDNDQTDTTMQLQDFWHLDHTTAVDPNKIDLFSVAVSEITAALGFGGAESFLSQTDGRDWLGGEVIALLGSGEDVLDPLAPGNIQSGTLSNRISDGAVQEVSLDPDIQTGERHELTVLDLAFLRDIGFDTIEPAIRNDADFDIDGEVDGEVDGNDFLVWQQGGSPDSLSASDLAIWLAVFGGISTVSAQPTSVPESSSLLLATCFLAAVINSRIRFAALG